MTLYLEQYDRNNAEYTLSIPWIWDGILRIPASLPDDDLLERAGILNSKIVKNIWHEIPNRSYRRGKLFTVQLHPERIFLFLEALKFFLQKAREEYSDIWIASNGQIAEW